MDLLMQREAVDVASATKIVLSLVPDVANGFEGVLVGIAEGR
jgi:hypothetical protein